ncbi:MAG: hypothetical protein M9894_30410 [Planctomycetes bacterium]|nr:hypothetical protein [Planctomycetota bacterium]
MSRPGRRPWSVLGVVLLCLAAWLGTALHVAIEPHDHDFAPAAPGAHGHGPGAPDHGHPDGEHHDADDHLLPACSRPTAEAGALLTLAPAPPRGTREPRSTPPVAAPPRDVPGPTTDPPPASRRPRAPPVG